MTDADDNTDVPTNLLRAYSAGETTRVEIAQQLGRSIGFGGLLLALQQAGLPLPRIRSTPVAPGTQIVRQLAERADAH